MKKELFTKPLRAQAGTRVGRIFTVVALLVGNLSGYPGHAQDDPPASDVEEGKAKAPDSSSESYHPPLTLDVTYGYGLSYTDSMLAAGWPFKAPAYLEAVGIELSRNFLDLTFSGAYAMREDIALSFTLPVGIVQLAAPPGSLPGLIDFGDFKPAIGEPSLGLAGRLLREDARRPSLSVFAFGNSANAKYSSLGDGFYSVTAGANLSKTVGKRISLLGAAGYTHRLSRESIEAGATIFARTGIGFLSPRRRFQTEIEITGLRIGATGQRSDLEEGRRNDYALSVGMRAAGSRHFVHINFYAPDGQLDLKQNALGLQYQMPLWPREPVVVPRPDRERKGHKGFVHRWLKRFRGRNSAARDAS